MNNKTEMRLRCIRRTFPLFAILPIHMNTAEQEQRDKRREAIGLALVIGYDLPTPVRRDKELMDEMITVVDEMLQVQTYGQFEQKAQDVSAEYRDEIDARFTTRFAEEKAREEREAAEQNRAVNFNPVTTRTSIIRELVPEITERLTTVRISTHSHPDLHERLARECRRYVEDRITARGSIGRPMIRLPKPDPFRP